MTIQIVPEGAKGAIIIIVPCGKYITQRKTKKHTKNVEEISQRSETNKKTDKNNQLKTRKHDKKTDKQQNQIS